MEIYKVKQDDFHFQELDLRVLDFIDSVPGTISYPEINSFSLENIAMKEFWPPMKTGFSMVEGQENLIPDITTWIDATLVLSPRAYRLLGDLLDPCGEFLPILIESGEEWLEYQIFNCLTTA